MKKIFTFLFALGIAGLASAQTKSSSYNKSWNGDMNHEQSHQSGSYGNSGSYSSGFSAREKEQQIQRINREFDQKIAAIKWDRHMRSRDKNRQIRFLEMQRDQQIKQVQMHFSGKNKFDDRGYSNDNHKW